MSDNYNLREWWSFSDRVLQMNNDFFAGACQGMSCSKWMIALLSNDPNINDALRSSCHLFNYNIVIVVIEEMFSPCERCTSVGRSQGCQLLYDSPPCYRRSFDFIYFGFELINMTRSSSCHYIDINFYDQFWWSVLFTSTWSVIFMKRHHDKFIKNCIISREPI